jgi:hypothetical protein
MVRIPGRHRVRPRRRWIVAATGAVIVAVFLAIGAMRPMAGPPMSGPTHSTLGGNAGVDLVCGGGTECGPDNPAIGVAPSPGLGPKVQP